MIYPLAYLALTSALTVVLLAVGLAGRAELAAELAVVQGALLATFYAFSANTRSLILQGHGALTPERLLAKRLLTLPAVCVAAYLLCVAAGVSASVAALVIARRSCEWLAEVRLCEIEVAAQRSAARRAFVAQVGATLVVAALLVFVPGSTTIALALFAVAPLVGSAPRVRLAALRPSTLRATFLEASPYIGSTAVEGISTYVVRLLVFIVAGAQMAGHLFTAFVLGSFIATLFANVLGPSFALSRARSVSAWPGLLVGGSVAGMTAAGVAIAGAAWTAGLGAWLGRPGYFWLALGLSLLGGGVMIVAQLIRLRLFDERQGDLLFGPDVLRNIVAIIAAPALYYLVSPDALAAVYLLTALLTVLVYWGAVRRGTPEVLDAVVAGAILLPVFFTLKGGLYHSPEAPLLEAVGVVNVPLPLALPVCFAGIVLLARYRQSTLSLATLFFLFVAMVLTSVVAAEGRIGEETRKFVLLFQFIVPAFALVLGEMIGAAERPLERVARGFSLVLLALVPLQLARSVGYGENQLHHDVWLFSVYQHLQYVPPVVVAAFLLTLFTAWDQPLWRRLHLLLAPLVAYYAASSYSTLAVLLAGGGAALFAAGRWRDRTALIASALVVAVLAGYFYVNRDAAPVVQKFSSSSSASEWRLSRKADAELPRSVAEALPGPVQVRLYYWQLYARGIAESGRAALFGHPRVMERDVATSAHNYYLDFVYNFGVLGFLPLAGLIVYTLLRLWRGRAALWREPPLLGLAIGVLFALLLDNMFKVPMRQPYPGIFFFFLWGLLIAQLQSPRR